jgi:NAD(P)-dependent dehydrogenase (short-subunit alcohol dehydrogenase family)
MVSSGLGSLTWLSEPAHPHHAVNILGYNSSRTALNALSLSLAKDLAKDVINAPPIPATRRRTSTITPDIAPSNRLLTPSLLAGQDASGPTGGFFFERSQAPW